MVSPCLVGVQAAIGPNLRFGEPMCVPAVLVFGFQTASASAVFTLYSKALCGFKVAET